MQSAIGQETVGPLLFHSQIFALGVIYDAPGARRAALDKFNTFASSVSSSSTFDLQFGESLRFTYKNVIKRAATLHESPLHDAHIIAFIERVRKREDNSSTSSLENLVEEIPDFGSGLALVLLKRRPKVSDQVIYLKCPYAYRNQECKEWKIWLPRSVMMNRSVCCDHCGNEMVESDEKAAPFDFL